MVITMGNTSQNNWRKTMTDPKVTEAVYAFETMMEAKYAAWTAGRIFSDAEATKVAAEAALEALDPAARREAWAEMGEGMGMK